MPGFDGTGPEGYGPLTGRGRGRCFVCRRRGVGFCPLPESLPEKE